ncbi:hypothetical protein [Paenibacillus koleovorans]|uniref:hypothetical protein n=1 Tax=Paenibacillus koleovorans TaxID=121608 RepID=UPI000FD9CBAA|nr:hypothetical protein [Paenibacillus koleovorans]
MHDVEKAKMIFIKYGGSHFHMERNGEFDYYKSFNILKQQEVAWIKEYQREIVEKLQASTDVSLYNTMLPELFRTITQFKIVDHLSVLNKFIFKDVQQLDSFTQLRVAEGFIGLLESIGNNNDNTILEIRQHTKVMLENISNQSMSVDSYYKKIDYLKDVLTDDKIRSRVKSSLNKLSENH